MENHPIPQDVTGFQFKLIGDMTVKQFAYLAGAGIMVYIALNLPLSILKYPLAILSGFFGISLAFFPVDGRPLDVMLTNYVRALLSPNQYVFQKVGGQFDFPMQSQKTKTKTLSKTSLTREKLKVYLQGMPRTKPNKLDDKENSFLSSVSSIFSGQGAFTSLPGQTPNISIMQEEPPKPVFENTPVDDVQKISEDEKIKEALEKETSHIQKELEEAKKLTSPEISSLQMHQKISELEKQLNETLSQKMQFEKELSLLRQKVASGQQKTFTPKESSHVRKIPKDMEKKLGAPISFDVPNLITGIVKDPRDNVLPGILVEIKDEEGNPVRAFKTNGLGQFASATPVANGTYTIEFEDPKGSNKFDAISIIAKGEIMEPLEVISEDEREDLRKMLFSN